MDASPGYYAEDVDRPEIVRWWDGDEWSDEAVVRIHSSHLASIRDDVRIMRNIMAVWAALTVLGMLVLAANV